MAPASMTSQTPIRPIAIAPARPGRPKKPDTDCNGDAVPPAMPFSCQTCARRKVKCDKASPRCSSCRKSQLDCVYEAPQPRARKRKLTVDVLERLTRYEDILRRHGLLDADTEQLHSAGETSLQDDVSLLWDDPATAKSGKLLAATVEDKPRYVSSKLWRNLGASDDDDEESPTEAVPDCMCLVDPLTAAFAGCPPLNLLQHHPTPKNALVLWEAHIENVEPLCKILHLPSAGSMVQRVSREPATASRAEECLLFAVYHFAVLSMTDVECASKLGQPRSMLLQHYNSATRHALKNAGFLRTSEFPVLQAFVLHLLASRHAYDPQTYWILTGAAVRIAQRVGLHRDGEKLGLPPFETEMRRRLFYQLMPLDARASQMAGMGASILPDSWDTRPPLNTNDDQLWPGMPEAPHEHKGATDMIFCLSRICLGKVFANRGGNATATSQCKDAAAAENAIRQAESEVEEKYIRYCDVVNPLHFLSICLARSGITAMRLRVRLPRAMRQTATDAETQEAFQLALRILDTDATVCSHADVERYRWHVESFFLWGTWDAVIFVLTTLWKKGVLFAGGEANAAWDKVEALYSHHGELLASKRALYSALGRLALKAWEATPKDAVAEPRFVGALRAKSTGSDDSKNGQQGINANSRGIVDEADVDPSALFAPEQPASPVSTGAAGVNDRTLWPNLNYGFDVNATDWAFWDQLLHGHPAGGSEE